MKSYVIALGLNVAGMNKKYVLLDQSDSSIPIREVNSAAITLEAETDFLAVKKLLRYVRKNKQIFSKWTNIFLFRATKRHIPELGYYRTELEYTILVLPLNEI